jgi:hypothetical protein
MQPETNAPNEKQIQVFPEIIHRGIETVGLLEVLIKAVGELLAEKRGIPPAEMIDKMFADAAATSAEVFKAIKEKA